MKKFMLITMAMLLMVSGCSTKKKEYVRDTGKGQVIQITLDDMVEKMEKKDESFVIAFTMHTCVFCQGFHEWLPDYIENHNIKVYDIFLDEEVNRSVQENRDLINKYFAEFSATPGIFYVKEGKNASFLPIQSNGIEQTYFDEWIQKNEIDQKAETE